MSEIAAIVHRFVEEPDAVPVAQWHQEVMELGLLPAAVACTLGGLHTRVNEATGMTPTYNTTTAKAACRPVRP